MANTLSDLMVNTLASPYRGNDIHLQMARQRNDRAILTFTGLESVGHIFPIVRMSGDVNIVGVQMGHTALGTVLTASIGIFPETNWALADGIAIDNAFYVDGFDVSSASPRVLDRLGQGSAPAGIPPASGQPIYIDAGDTLATRKRAYDIALTIETSGTPLSGSMVIFMKYVAGD